MVGQGVPRTVFRQERLDAFGDRIVLRDPRGRSAQPAILHERSGGPPTVGGAISVVQRYTIAKSEGGAFVETTGDSNPIHRDGGIVPGAMLSARALLLPELLFEHATEGRARLIPVRHARFRFRGFALYGEPTVNLYRIQPGPDGELCIQVEVRQRETSITEGTLRLRAPGSAVGPVDQRELLAAERPNLRLSRETVHRFLQSLRVDPALYAAVAGDAYPRAFLASLPSGEMVRHFSGEGGLLNVLDLEFTAEALTMAESGPPPVELEDTREARLSFRKVVTRVAQGVRTFCRGFAMVLPATAAQKTALAGAKR